MITYKIMENDKAAKSTESVIVELQLTTNGGQPGIQARNPGGNWENVCFLDDAGGLALCYPRGVDGLKLNNKGMIEAY